MRIQALATSVVLGGLCFTSVICLARSADAPEVFQSMGHGQTLESLESARREAVTGKKRVPTLTKVSANALPALDPDGNLEDFKVALQRQLARCAQQSATETWTFGSRRLTRRQWCTETGQKFLTLAQASPDFATLYARAKTEFEWYQSNGRDGQGEVLFTGYYYPQLNGSWQKDATHTYPLYRQPDDLVQVSVNGSLVWRRKLPNGGYGPFYTREDIDTNGALAGKGLEIVWVDDVFGAFILQVQGSGEVMVTEADGSVTRVIVNYAAQNGQGYVSIGSVLRAQGVPAEYLTLQGMRRYFNEHPEKFWPTLNANPSYVFFKRDTEGPFGSAGTILTPWHSIAVDTSLFPMGATALYLANRPMAVQGDQGLDWQPFTRLAVAQDTGGAIKGAGHVDTYWGSGTYAEVVAGQMANTGKLFFAVVPPTRHIRKHQSDSAQ